MINQNDPDFERKMAAERCAIGAKNALDTQVGGDHYKSMPIQPIEFITKNEIPFIEGNVIKYICRHASKNGIQDIEKVIHYCNLLIDLKYPTHKRENGQGGV
jgi:hypothetical protein